MAGSGQTSATDAAQDALARTTAWQADHTERAGAPITSRIVRAVPAIARTDSATGRRIANWAGLKVEDAMQLRIAGGLHFLHLTGEEERLAPVYAGLVTDQPTVDAIVCAAVEKFDHVLLPWLDHPPQTNEAARSVSVMTALLWLSGRLGPQFELNEIGASAGANTLMGRYRYDLGGVQVGPSLSRMVLAPEWRGPPPPDNPVEIVAARGCDLAPVDLTDPEQAMKLRAYIWHDMSERMGRLDTVIDMARRAPPDLARMDAAAFVEEVLASEQAAGTTRVLFHTIVWQYLPDVTRDAINAAMEQAGAQASPERPLAWVQVETNRQAFRHEMQVRLWNGEQAGGSDWVKLCAAHPHGAWVEWLGGKR